MTSLAIEQVKHARVSQARPMAIHAWINDNVHGHSHLRFDFRFHLQSALVYFHVIIPNAWE